MLHKIMQTKAIPNKEKNIDAPAKKRALAKSIFACEICEHITMKRLQ